MFTIKKKLINVGKFSLHLAYTDMLLLLHYSNQSTSIQIMPMDDTVDMHKEGVKVIIEL